MLLPLSSEKVIEYLKERGMYCSQDGALNQNELLTGSAIV